MNLITITSRPKETIIGAVKRAVDNSTLYGKIVNLNYKGIESLVYPNENGSGAITYVAQRYNILKKYKLAK